MKKLVILMVLILMAFFIFSPQVSAINLTVTPKEPEAVPICRNVVFNWSFYISPPQIEDYYTFKIFDPNGMPVHEKGSTIKLGEGNITNSYSWHVPEGSSSGRYVAEIRHSSGHPSATEPFLVGPTGNLTICKFNDSNPNRKRDSDERGLHGWDFTIRYIDDPRVKPFTITTGIDGNGTRYNIAVGNYSITEKKEEKGRCWRNSTPITNTTVVKKDQTTIVNFGNYEVGTLRIIKFNDFDSDGKQDENEPNLPDWDFKIKFPNGTSIDVTTGEDGTYTLHDASVGSYEIEERKKKGWMNTTPITQEKEVKACLMTNVSFGNTIPPLIISKFYDHNQNGRRDKGEEGVPNWEFIITKDGRTVATGKTDANGFWNPELPDGTYTITERPRRWWRNSTPTERTVEIKPSQRPVVEFGNYEVGTLHIHKFNDTNHNGKCNDGELPLPNWGFRIKDPDGFVDITRYTDDNGSIKVELPANVKYNVTETLRVGWNNSTPLMQYADIKPCEDTWLTFGNYNITPIVIHKFNDTNRNGVRERGEEGLAGWEFKITGPSVDKKITNNKGDAIFRDVIPGQYKIEEIMSEDQREDNWTATTPLIREEVEVTEGQKVKIGFGNFIDRPCEEIYMPPEEPGWHNNSDGCLNVSKYIDPRIVHCDNPNPNAGEIINVTLRVCALTGMPPIDIVLAVDTSGSLVERGGVVLEVMRDGITDFIQKNKARFGENVRIGLVSWDEKIDETVNLTTDYDKIKKACGNLSSNPEEDTLYQVGLNGSIDVFTESPRENVKKVIVLITDAKGTCDGLSKYSELPDTSAYVIHAITVGPTQDNDTVNMLKNFTSQYNGTAVRVNESYEELEKELTNLTVSCIERRTLKNVTVVETLPNYMRALNESYEIPPTSERINSDGMEWNTVTMKWDIGDLSSDECWENTFKAIFCCRVPADETQPEGISGITSEVTYSDPTNISITKHLPIPEGGIWIRPLPWWKTVPQWMWIILGAMVIAIITIATYCYVRIRRREG